MSDDQPTGRDVLLVDSDTGATQFMLTLLRHYGYGARASSSISDAISQINSEPEFVLLSLDAPDDPAAAILKHVRQRRLRTKVIITTSVRDKSRLQALAALKPDAVLLKPVNFLDLLDALGPAIPPRNDGTPSSFAH
jgi:DNA-binding NtrC family response regulator